MKIENTLKRLNSTKEKVTFLIFTIAGIFPVYTVVCWIYIFRSYPKFSHLEKQRLYNQTFFGGANITGNPMLQWLVVLLGLSAVCYFGFLIFQPNKKHRMSKFSGITYVCLFVIFLLFTFLNIWSLL